MPGWTLESRERELLGFKVHALTLQEARDLVISWAGEGRKRIVCAADANMVMTWRRSGAFREVLAQADLVTPDGMALVWALRKKGDTSQPRVCGPDLSWALFEAAESAGIPVGFFGGRPEVLDALRLRLKETFPKLQIAYSCSPPFFAKPVPEVLDPYVLEILNSDVKLLFIGLGCPKQEQWAVEASGRLPIVMLAVGAAFDFHAGTLKRAPAWIQTLGMEWIFRLMLDPVRLWRRAFLRIIPFTALVGWEYWINPKLPFRRARD